MTFGEVSKIIKSGEVVKITTYYNNTMLYYIDERGIAMRRYNKCKPVYFIGFNENNNEEVNFLYKIDVLSKKDLDI